MPEDIHPQIQAILDRGAELGIPKIQDLSVADARALVERMAEARREASPPPEMLAVDTRSTGAGYGHAPVRIYRPKADDRAPAVVFFHGGGYVFGGFETHDGAARAIAARTGFVVIAVDYRMAPEHPFPAAIEDGCDTVRWVADNASMLGVDPLRIAVCGDSAGGNLAAVAALAMRDGGEVALAAQALIYPIVDWRCASPAYERYGAGYGILEAETMRWFRDRYLPNEQDAADWRASPIHADLAALPPALVLTAGCDVLLDDGRAYAEALEHAGVTTEYVEMAGMVHGFFQFLGQCDGTEEAHDHVATFLKRALG